MELHLPGSFLALELTFQAAIRIDRVRHSPFAAPSAVFPFLEQFAESERLVAAAVAVAGAVAAAAVDIDID